MTQDLLAGSERIAAGMADEQPLLSVDGLNAWYGAAHILFDLSLTVQRGEVVALMGRNGAGKSTTLKSIMGLMERCDGHIEFMGQAIHDKQPFEIARAGLGFVPEDRRIFTDLSVTEIWKWDVSQHGAGPMVQQLRTGSPSACTACFRIWVKCRIGPVGR